MNKITIDVGNVDDAGYTVDVSDGVSEGRVCMKGVPPESDVELLRDVFDGLDREAVTTFDGEEVRLIIRTIFEAERGATVRGRTRTWKYLRTAFPWEKP